MAPEKSYLRSHFNLTKERRMAGNQNSGNGTGARYNEERKQEVLEFAKRNPEMTKTEIANEFGMSIPTITRIVDPEGKNKRRVGRRGRPVSEIVKSGTNNSGNNSRNGGRRGLMSQLREMQEKIRELQEKNQELTESIEEIISEIQ